mmetsp:Transcript_23476/g.36163  ORF Transcript_23476/g.36163 Transcript_23476/m.36163 type:complete len:184 (-) Transcript_23476:2298-2849(-)
MSCTYPKTGRGYFEAPTIVSVTSTEINIEWTPPSDTGGCNITGYAIYIKDPDDTSAEYDSANVRDKPFLSTYTIDMSSKTAGSTYDLYLGVENRIGEVQSDTVAVLLASVPDTPSTPQKSLLNSTHMQIVMSPPSSNGGSIITSYELQVSDEGGELDWQTVLGKDEDERNLDLIYTLPIVTGK